LGDTMFELNSFSSAWFLAAGSFVLMVFVAVGLFKTRSQRRIEELADGDTTPMQSRPISRSTNGFSDRNAKKQAQRFAAAETLDQRIARAGYRDTRTIGLLFSLRMVFLAAAVGLGVLLAALGLISMQNGMIFGSLIGLAATVAPGIWLDQVRKQRQRAIRRALPDALDVMVICLEGGVSLAGSFSRVARELATAQPMLAMEFNVVQRQIQMGHTTGEAIRSLAERFDLDELRSMASVITQAEKMGSSVVTALQVFADTLRQKRHQRAEELGHKAAVKLLFPTIFFIFPGIFIVILGPAAIQIYQQLINGAFKVG